MRIVFVVMVISYFSSVSTKAASSSHQFVLNVNDEDGAEVQAAMFCAERVSDEDAIDACVAGVLKQVYAQAPHLRPDSDGDDDDNDNDDDDDDVVGTGQEKKLNFVLQPGQDPIEETESFCRSEVLPKDVLWCQRELQKQVYAKAPHLRDGGVDENCKMEEKGKEKKKKDSQTRTKKKKLKNIARGHPVKASSDDGSNYISSVVDGCKSDCFLSWCSDPSDSRARITLDLEEPHCVRAVKLFWDEEFTPGTIKIRGNEENLLLSRKNLEKKLNRIDSMRLIPKAHIGIDIKRYMYFDFSEKHADDFDLIELQVFGEVGRCGGGVKNEKVEEEEEEKEEKKNEKEDTVIVVVAYNRPKYLHRVLNSLAKCDGIERYPVHIFIDPVDQLVTRKNVEFVAKAFESSRTLRVSTHKTRLGPHKNIQHAVNDAFKSHDARFVIVLEDDVILSQDALSFMEYARDTFENDTNVFTATGYSNNCHRENCIVDSAFHHRTTRRKHFTPWFWGTWRDRWQEFHKSGWTGWDVEMNFELTKTRSIVQKPNSGLRGERVEVFPIFSRANNIGFEDGFHAHVYTPKQMRELQYITCWADECNGRSVVSSSSDFSELKDFESILETLKV